MRVDEERERMARDEDDCVREEAGDGGGAGRGWGVSERGNTKSRSRQTLS